MVILATFDLLLSKTSELNATKKNLNIYCVISNSKDKGMREHNSQSMTSLCVDY